MATKNEHVKNEHVMTVLSEAIPRGPFAWLRERRWFSSKGESLNSLRVADWGALPLAEPAIMALVAASYASGRDDGCGASDGRL
jgi:Maltokinase N-terminal cap domain